MPTKSRLLGFILCFDAIALLILYPHIDLYSGGYLLISTALGVLQCLVNQRFAASEDMRRLFYAKDIDAVWDKWVAVLGLAEFAVFFEYAHWRLVPGMVCAAAQASGLGLSVAGCVWLGWVDSYLVDNFASHHRRGALLTSGPYRLVRHPRYLGLLATRLALPLIFGSVVGCVVALIWLFLIRRRARLEEQYLRNQFGSAYTTYASQVIGIP